MVLAGASAREKLTPRRHVAYSWFVDCTCAVPPVRRSGAASAFVAAVWCCLALVSTTARADDDASPASEEQRDGRTRAERRRVEQLDLGRRSSAHRLIRQGPTDAQLRAAGGAARPGSLLYPVPGARIGRGHGSGTNGYHKALDIMASEGTPILAAERGLVAYTGNELRGYGELVVVLHPGGWITYYAHCSAFVVRPGQVVERGQRIARVGNTGISRGPHLHFELWMEGEKVDPYPFLRPAPGVPRSGPLPHVGHRVRRGDTWSSLAERYGMPAGEIRAANHLDDDSPLRVGWQVLIPVRMDSVPPESIGGDPGAEEDGTYVVEPGDTLSEIAERFSIPLDDFARWNDLADPSRIRAGMTLVLGGEAEAAEEPATEGGGTASGAAEADDAPAVAAADPPTEAPGAGTVDAEAGDVHVVAVGETLAAIAHRLGLRARDLVQANPGLDPDRLRPGQRLAIPDVGGGRPDEQVRPDGGAAPEELTASYVVRKGDSLWLVARRFRTSMDRIRALNPGLGDGSGLQPGQRLRVPREER
ncbi:MAG: LysM peptidoglycan-binding domain-containing protein [Deltaproteobacteria bacterium]|nr:LysM peptidoglycan-binding domain-containing protein [Deltaproteobacteria bacterium]